MRYLPLTDLDRGEMLTAIGVDSIDALFADVPPAARLDGLVDLPRAMGELEVERAISHMASRNVAAGSVPFFIGGGAYRHHIPAAVDHLIQRGEFLTSYTPYQPELAQGTLQYLFEFQTQVALLTGMQVANASLYDGATACAEAVMMANRLTRRRKAVLSGGLHPHYREVCETYARFVGFELDALDPAPGPAEDLNELVGRDVSCVVVQNPGFFGEIRDYSDLARNCHDAGALLVVVVTEILSLGAIVSPGEMGADIVAAEGQSLGNALAFTIHLALLGETGLARLARLNHAAAVALAERLERIQDVRLLNAAFFNEFALRLPGPAAAVVDALAEKGALAGIPASRFYPDQPELADVLVVAATEMVTTEDIDRLERELREALA
jgi:glycine dehydrogenase subunit 1